MYLQGTENNLKKGIENMTTFNTLNQAISFAEVRLEELEHGDRLFVSKKGNEYFVTGDYKAAAENANIVATLYNI